METRLNAPSLRVAVLSISLLILGCKRNASPNDGATAPPATSQPASSARATQELSIAAAADLRYALQDVATHFRAAHPEFDVKITYGSSGNFFAQISNHAPFDLFLSADALYPEKLIAQGEGKEGSEFTYAIGHLVLWAPKGSKFDPATRKMDALSDPSLKTVAIANPDHAPYGRAAEAALKKQNLWDKLQPKLVRGGNISETATMVQSGSADIGLIALSLAKSPSMKNAGTYYEIPANDYPTMNQAGVILSYAKDVKGAEAFKECLLGPEAQSILRSYGFAAPSAGHQ